MENRLQVDTSFNKDIEKAALTVAPLFKLFGWTWGGPKNGIPNLQEIEHHITTQVEELLESEGRFTSTSSGRITSRLCFDGDEQYIEVSLDLATLYDDGV